MNIYFSHSGGYDYKKDLYEPIKKSQLATIHRFFLPHEPQNIDINAVDELKHTSVLVAEASLPSTGQGIELGQAYVAGVPIICFYKTGFTPSNSLRFVTQTIIEYTTTDDFLAKLQLHLEQRSANS